MPIRGRLRDRRRPGRREGHPGRAAHRPPGHLADSVHLAAGVALCRAAGCTVTGLYGEPLHTGAGGPVAAAGPRRHAAPLELVRGQRD
ncbi:hypothetical protein ACR9VJ_35230 [Streptomyces sp. H49]|uniref:hypothetical protein n=1 Tax=Streptomyces sp. H49 TaxID=3444117 RepID=UPI003F4ABFA5